MRELSGVPAPVNITSIIISDDHCWHVLALETHQQVNYHIAGNFGRVSNLAVWRSGEIIAKLNSADINSPWLRLAGRPLKYIWLHTVPVLQDNCIHSRECDVGDSSLSLSLSPGRNFVSLTRCALGEADCGQQPLRARSHLGVQDTLERARMGRCADKDSLAKAFLSLKSQATMTWSTSRLGLHRSGDITVGVWGPEWPNLKLTKLNYNGILAEITKFNPNQIFLLYGMYFHCIATHQAVVHQDILSTADSEIQQ